MESVFNFLAGLVRWSLTLYEWIILLAIVLTWVNPDPNNPVVRFLRNMTIPFWNWLSARLPGPFRLFAAYVSLLVVWFLKIFLPGSLATLGITLSGQLDGASGMARVGGYFLLGLGGVFSSFFTFLVILLLIWFFLTLTNPSLNNPIVQGIALLVDPFISPLQHRMPRTRVDYSPLLASALILLFNMLIVRMVADFGRELTRSGTVF